MTANQNVSRGIIESVMCFHHLLCTCNLHVPSVPCSVRMHGLILYVTIVARLNKYTVISSEFTFVSSFLSPGHRNICHNCQKLIEFKKKP